MAVTVEMKRATEDWLDKARSDLDDARFNSQGGRSQLAAFMLQQSAEKALKALQIEETGDFDRTHDLFKLSRAVEIPDRFLAAFEELNPVYTGFRYPDVAEGEIENVEQLLKTVEDLLKWTERRLKR